MGMPVQLESVIVITGKETRLKENYFQIVKEGYHLFPLDTSLIVKRMEDDEIIGSGVINKLEWSEGKTTIIYRLTALKTIN
ncbi:DUF2584 family protein [Caldifermentibacillus hisashii]|jgi:hypothetical protein|uniref:DUF2584 family protein n=1 Tax=Caldifermentibacillus hisashii TaxID=996558 RepID=A0ABU9K165_9BACI|nr:DUF2584 family protein [Caldibacillus thermoamylovorans]MCM3477501.1 DUF2584 domain-containing protein [Caldibacillus thermoamylovorans]